MSKTKTKQDVTFRDFSLSDSLRRSIDEAGFETPTPIQAQLIPPALEGRDVIGLAQTGTGKTAAFAIPIIERLAGRLELGAVVLAPTRELAMQITGVFEQLGAHSGIRTATIMGGTKMDDDQAALVSWPNVLIATPGRLIDHIENGGLSLDEVETFVVDEADRMHDMGFIPQIRKIVAVLPPDRQTIMVTATMHDDVEQIARKHMDDPERIQIGVTAPAHRARQELFEVGEDDRSPLLQKLLREREGRVLVFMRTKKTVDRITRVLKARGFAAEKIHGGLEQMMREHALGDFRTGDVRILVATDIAARGLDISDIEQVINYDFPHNPEDYVHRVGRTARVEASGVATSFVTPADQTYVRAVRKLIGDKLPRPERLRSYDESKERKGGRGGKGRGGRSRGGRGKSRRRGGRGRAKASGKAAANR